MPYNNTFNSNAAMMNQLYRQKDNIENMIAQYTQNMGMNSAQPPVQNIINTSNGNPSETDVRFLNQNEDIANIIISRKTLFIDEKNGKIDLKEVDGSISKHYDIIIPKDEKDIKIEELENKLKELEERFNVQHAKPIVTNTDVKSTTTSNVKPIKSTTKTDF